LFAGVFESFFLNASTLVPVFLVTIVFVTHQLWHSIMSHFLGLFSSRWFWFLCPRTQ